MKIPRRPITATLIATLTVLCVPISAQNGVLNCASNDGRYHYCRADTQNRVRLVQQFSNSPCNQGYSWGFDYRGVWVDRGCRAQFEFGRRNNGGNTGAAVAAGVIGAIIVGAAVASSNNDSGDNRAQLRREYYEDGYRSGQRDWDDDRAPKYMRYSDRFPRDYENDFAAGYDDGYNNRRNKYR
jgi:hypothetical protein